MNNFFLPADILLPKFLSDKDAMQRYAVIACDQYTAEPQYWDKVDKLVGDSVSTYHLILPEAYLGKENKFDIESVSKDYIYNAFDEYKDIFIYLERKLKDGSVRKGLIGKIDLESYDYSKSSVSPVRATEGTVIERLPPRVALRKSAYIELPHIMLLIDDKKNTVISSADKAQGDVLYDFDLMLGAGHVNGKKISRANANDIMSALSNVELAGSLAYAVGDGNHSLAAAKQHYDAIKAVLGEKALTHPSRYALCELVNIYDDALGFEPIYRLVFDADIDEFTADFGSYLSAQRGSFAKQSFTLLSGDKTVEIVCNHPQKSLPVATLQDYLDKKQLKIDYIHGVESLKSLATSTNIGILFDGMKKGDLFPSVIADGALPRKTFSMGHADDKRFYLEARKIKE